MKIIDVAIPKLDEDEESPKSSRETAVASKRPRTQSSVSKNSDKNMEGNACKCWLRERLWRWMVGRGEVAWWPSFRYLTCYSHSTRSKELYLQSWYSLGAARLKLTISWILWSAHVHCQMPRAVCQ
jgi:hypothetical protein